MGSWNLQPFRLGSRSSFLTAAQEQHARLELLYPADSAANAVVDIILVAGLGGDYIKTWQAEDGTLWPRDLLPKEIPNIRVQSFHYNTTIQGTTSKAKITDHAVQLLDALDLDRSTDVEAATRPIIFVGHSLGGMLIKYTVSYAKSEAALKYASVWDATRGVMFFATPHHGMDFRSWRDFASAVLRLQGPFPGVLPTEKMLKDISLNTGSMVRITEDFKPLQRELAFVNFFEGNNMKGQDRVLVDKSHGWMDADPTKKKEYLIEGDHVGLCKFGTRYHSDIRWFKLVLKSMKFLIEQSPKAIDQIDGDARRALHSLCPTGFHGYFMAKEPTEGTCNWISERPEFQEWLDDQNDKQMLWIQGPPACGKSYLAKHIITELAPAANKEVSHCFLSDSVPGRGNIAALLRATLHHALRRQPQLISKILVPPFLKATRGKAIRVRDDDIWTRDLLIYLWPDAIADVLGFRPLTLVVDGFDQIDNTSRQEFLDCLAECKERAGHERTRRLRVLLLSTESEAAAGVDEGGQPAEPLRGREEFQVYQVTADDTLPDREKTIIEQLKKPEVTFGILDSVTEDAGGAELQRKEICAAILEHSNGSYQLATKAAEVLSNSLVTTTNQVEAAKEIIQNLPRNDTDFLAKQLNELLENTVGPTLLRHVLSWVLCQLEPLLEAEFCTAVALGMALDEQSYGRGLRGAMPPERLLQGSRQVYQTKVLVQTHCHQLIELGDGPVKLVNSGLKKLLRTTETSMISEDSNVTTQLNPGLAKYLDHRTCHATLAGTCIAYLTLPCFQDAGVPLTSETESSERWKSKVRRRIKTYPLVRYASLNWFRHLKEATAFSEHRDRATCNEPSDQNYDQDPEKLQVLQDSTTGYAQSWTEVYWFLSNGGNIIGAEDENSPHFPAGLVIQAYCPNPRSTIQDSKIDSVLIPTPADSSSSIGSEPSTPKPGPTVESNIADQTHKGSESLVPSDQSIPAILPAKKMDLLDGVDLEPELAGHGHETRRATMGELRHVALMRITTESITFEGGAISDAPVVAEVNPVEDSGDSFRFVIEGDKAGTAASGSEIRETEKQEDRLSRQPEKVDQVPSEEGLSEPAVLESHPAKDKDEVEPIAMKQDNSETEKSSGSVDELTTDDSKETEAVAVGQFETETGRAVYPEGGSNPEAAGFGNMMTEGRARAEVEAEADGEGRRSVGKVDVGVKEGAEKSIKGDKEAEAETEAKVEPKTEGEMEAEGMGKEVLAATPHEEYSDERARNEPNDSSPLSMGRPGPLSTDPIAKFQEDEEKANIHHDIHTKALFTDPARERGAGNHLHVVLRPEHMQPGGPSSLAQDKDRVRNIGKAAAVGRDGDGSKFVGRIDDHRPSERSDVQAERENASMRATEESTGHVPSTPDKKPRGLARMYARVKTGIKKIAGR